MDSNQRGRHRACGRVQSSCSCKATLENNNNDDDDDKADRQIAIDLPLADYHDNLGKVYIAESLLLTEMHVCS